VDTLGQLLALHVTAADTDDRAAVAALADSVQEATGQSVELAYVDQGYTGERAEGAAAAHGIRLEVVKLPEAKRGFVLLPRRWVVERSFAWMARCRRLARATTNACHGRSRAGTSSPSSSSCSGAPLIWPWSITASRCVIPECRGAFSRQQEDALWLQVFTVQPARRREFEPNSKRRKRRPAASPSATG
jgi:transposase